MADDITVFLLDDHEIVRRGIRNLLDYHDGLVVVGEAGTASQATEAILRLRPDVAVLDARLPDGSGIEVCRDVRAVDSGIAVIILTSYDDDEALFSAIMAGAAGYALKQIRGNDLVDAVRRVAEGQSLLDPAVTSRVLERIRSGPGPEEPFDVLSHQERRILDLIAEGMTNREIAEQMYLAEKTVKNYVTALLAKLGLQRRTQAAVMVQRHRRDPAPPDPV